VLGFSTQSPAQRAENRAERPDPYQPTRRSSLSPPPPIGPRGADRVTHVADGVVHGVHHDDLKVLVHGVLLVVGGGVGGGDCGGAPA